jgi:hypothetical protein
MYGAQAMDSNPVSPAYKAGACPNMLRGRIGPGRWINTCIARGSMVLPKRNDRFSSPFQGDANPSQLQKHGTPIGIRTLLFGLKDRPPAPDALGVCGRPPWTRTKIAWVQSPAFYFKLGAIRNWLSM